MRFLKIPSQKEGITQPLFFLGKAALTITYNLYLWQLIFTCKVTVNLPSLTCMKSIYLFLLLSSFVSNAFAQTASKGGSFSDLAFIEGRWEASSEGRTVEASWLPPSTDNMVGFFRMSKDGKLTMYELLAYEQSDKGLVSLVKHFQPGLIGQEEKDNSVRSYCVEASKGKVTFEQEGTGVRILYEQRSKDQFIISLGKQEQGKWIFKPLFDFKRVK